MNRKDEITAQIAAHRATLNYVAGQLAELEAELLQIEADAPKPFILREVHPEPEMQVETVKITPAEVPAPEVSDELVSDMNSLLSTEVHNIEGTARTRNGRGGAKAAQTRKINQLVEKHSHAELTAALDAAKADKDMFLHYTKGTRNKRTIASAENAIAYRLGL